MKYLLTVEPGASVPSKRFISRQGLSNILDESKTFTLTGGASTTLTRLSLAPDGTKGILTYGTSTYYITDLENLTRTATTSGFSGAILGSTASNTHYAFFGQSTSYLNVFRWSDHGLETIVKTGLGTVYSGEFSPDGTKLALTHSTSPYIRVYNTSDWSYVEPSAVPGNSTNVCGWGDNSTLLVFSAVTPYIVKYTADLVTRTTVSTSSIYATNNADIVSTSSTYVKRVFRTNTANKVICIMPASNNAGKFYRLDFSTNTVEETFSISSKIVAADIDLVEEKIHYTTDDIASQGVTGIHSKNINNLTDSSGVRTYSNILSAQNVSLLMLNVDYGVIAGTVRDVDNNPAARVVRAYRRSDGLLVAQTTSDAITGDYTLRVPTTDTEAYDVQFMIESGELLNDLFYARTTAAAA